MTYTTSIQGIEKEIKRRESKLRLLRMWYKNPTKTGTVEFNLSSFYKCGIRTLKELKKLKIIKQELVTLETFSFQLSESNRERWDYRTVGRPLEIPSE